MVQLARYEKCYVALLDGFNRLYRRVVRLGASVAHRTTQEPLEEKMRHMASVHDVAAYILRKRGRMSAMKLQKLVYYSQAWSLVWDDEPLFSERIEAWANGPVAPDLYAIHRGQFDVTTWPQGDVDKLSKTAKETIDVVLDYYAKHSAQVLSDLTHNEAPWKDARVGLAPGERGSRTITHESMMEYYSSLEANDSQE